MLFDIDVLGVVIVVEGIWCVIVGFGIEYVKSLYGCVMVSIGMVIVVDGWMNVVMLLWCVDEVLYCVKFGGCNCVLDVLLSVVDV